MELRAETAYNIAMALPQPELQRLFAMLDKHQKPKAAVQSKKKSNVWSVEECTEVLIKFLNDSKKKRLQRKLV